MPKEPTLRERVESLELIVDSLYAQSAESAESAADESEEAAARRKLDDLTTATAAMNADRIGRIIEVELQSSTISTLRVRNLAVAYLALKQAP